MKDFLTQNDGLRLHILAIEEGQARAVREHLLGDPSALPRLKAMDDQISALRAQLTPE